MAKASYIDSFPDPPPFSWIFILTRCALISSKTGGCAGGGAGILICTRLYLLRLCSDIAETEIYYFGEYIGKLLTDSNLDVFDLINQNLYRNFAKIINSSFFKGILKLYD